MDEGVQRIFLDEIAFQCGLILDGKRLFDQGSQPVDIEGLTGPRTTVEQTREMQRRIQAAVTRQWAGLQTITSAAANISKLLWGSGGRKEGQRQQLRDRLSVPDDSCLKSTDLRNDFEHFDERIEVHYAGTDARGFVGRNTVPVELKGQAAEELASFGQYNPASGDLTFWSNSVNIPEIEAEAARLLPLAQEEALKGGWVQ
jgi:hypothetical protein